MGGRGDPAGGGDGKCARAWLRVPARAPAFVGKRRGGACVSPVRVRAGAWRPVCVGVWVGAGGCVCAPRAGPGPGGAWRRAGTAGFRAGGCFSPGSGGAGCREGSVWAPLSGGAVQPAASSLRGAPLSVGSCQDGPTGIRASRTSPLPTPGVGVSIAILPPESPGTGVWAGRGWGARCVPQVGPTNASQCPPHPAPA